MNPVIPLSKMNAGQKGAIVNFTGNDGEICQRLQEMGLTKGTHIEVVRFAPMGDPIDVKVRGYHLSLRRQEADVINIMPDSPK